MKNRSSIVKMIPPTDKPKQMYIVKMYDGVTWRSVRVYSNKIKSDRRRVLYTYGTYDKTKYYLMSCTPDMT